MRGQQFWYASRHVLRSSHSVTALSADQNGYALFRQSTTQAATMEDYFANLMLKCIYTRGRVQY